MRSEWTERDLQNPSKNKDDFKCSTCREFANYQPSGRGTITIDFLEHLKEDWQSVRSIEHLHTGLYYALHKFWKSLWGNYQDPQVFDAGRYKTRRPFSIQEVRTSRKSKVVPRGAKASNLISAGQNGNYLVSNEIMTTLMGLEKVRKEMFQKDDRLDVAVTHFCLPISAFRQINLIKMFLKNALAFHTNFSMLLVYKEPGLWLLTKASRISVLVRISARISDSLPKQITFSNATYNSTACVSFSPCAYFLGPTEKGKFDGRASSVLTMCQRRPLLCLK